MLLALGNTKEGQNGGPRLIMGEGARNEGAREEKILVRPWEKHGRGAPRRHMRKNARESRKKKGRQRFTEGNASENRNAGRESANLRDVLQWKKKKPHPRAI